jgi:transcriptional regulator with XRE-family HTH domain
MNQSKLKQAKLGDLAEVLRGFIVDSGLTMYALAQLAGVDRKQLRLFLHGEAGITLDTASQLCGVLELDLVPRRRRGGTPTYARAKRARKVQPAAEQPGELILDRTFPSEDIIIHRDDIVPGPHFPEQELERLTDRSIKPGRPEHDGI